MITSLSIERFKSIRALTLPCRKVNVFIGPPDTGKTNILDALTLLANLGWRGRRRVLQPGRVRSRVSRTLAVECLADLDVFHLLRDTLGLPLRKLNAIREPFDRPASAGEASF